MSVPGAPRRRSDIVTEHLPDGSAVLFDQEKTTAYPISASAAMVWDACDGTEPVVALVDRLVSVYDVPAERAAHDVAMLLQDLETKGVLVASGGDM
jgi:hypothetical protein